MSAALPRHDDDKGASLVEYALMLAMVAVVAVVAMRFLGDTVSTGLDSSTEAISAAN